MSRPYRYCPQCGQNLQMIHTGGMPRNACVADGCGFVHWDNPVPVVAAIVEHEGKVLLARNVAWPKEWYALITGFLERGEDPATGVMREVKEELDLEPQGCNFVGIYEFRRMNQLIIAYHVPATGTVKLNEELNDYKYETFEDARYWDAGTGYALRDWLRSKGFEPKTVDWARGAN